MQSSFSDISLALVDDSELIVSEETQERDFSPPPLDLNAAPNSK